MNIIRVNKSQVGKITAGIVLASLSAQGSILRGVAQAAENSPMDMGGPAARPEPQQPPKTSAMAMNAGDMEMVHPFFTHMGMPDPVGQYVLRLSAVSVRKDGGTVGDFGFHLETGLAKYWGLHVRNDLYRGNAHTEVAFQYAAIRSRDGMSGISPFLEIELPTGKDERHTYGVLGISTAWMGRHFAFNQSLEYSPKENALEGSAAIVTKIGTRFFPVVEFIGSGAKGQLPQNSILGGIKYRFQKQLVVGVGYKVPVASSRDFRDQVLVQTDIEWQ